MKPYIKIGMGMVIGGVLGFAYYYFVGCKSGTCPLTSKPLITSGYGAVIGMLITSVGSKSKKNEE